MTETIREAFEWYQTMRDEIPPGDLRMEAALRGYAAGQEAAIETSPLLIWLETMKARVEWNTFGVGTPGEAPVCKIALRDHPFAVAAPSFKEAAAALKLLYERKNPEEK